MFKHVVKLSLNQRRKGYCRNEASGLSGANSRRACFVGWSQCQR